MNCWLDIFFHIKEQQILLVRDIFFSIMSLVSQIWQEKYSSVPGVGAFKVRAKYIMLFLVLLKVHCYSHGEKSNH